MFYDDKIFENADNFNLESRDITNVLSTDITRRKYDMNQINKVKKDFIKI